MRARDYNSIFSTGGKFHPDYGLLLEFHALTLVARSYALLRHAIQCSLCGCIPPVLSVTEECLSVTLQECFILYHGSYSLFQFVEKSPN